MSLSLRFVFFVDDGVVVVAATAAVFASSVAKLLFKKIELILHTELSFFFHVLVCAVLYHASFIAHSFLLAAYRLQ